MNRRLLSALCFVMLAANAMGEEPVTFPDVEWEVRTPAEVGLDVAKLQELSASVGGAGAIVRNGYMVYTWGDQNARTWQAWASASKSMFSTMRSVKAEMVKKGLTSRADRIIDPSAT